MTLFAMSGVGHGGSWPRCPEPLGSGPRVPEKEAMPEAGRKKRRVLWQE